MYNCWKVGDQRMWLKPDEPKSRKLKETKKMWKVLA